MTATETNQVTWDQRVVAKAVQPQRAAKPEYQELKIAIHRKLLDKINLEALASIDDQQIREEIRQSVIALINAEPTLLSAVEKQQISEEVLAEVFGLGPLEPLLK